MGFEDSLSPHVSTFEEIKDNVKTQPNDRVLLKSHDDKMSLKIVKKAK